MKKKIGFVVLLLLLIITLSSCNMSVGWGSYTFTKIHCFAEHKCIEITNWHDNEMGIEIKQKSNGEAMYFSEGTYALIEKTCPYCSATIDTND